MTEPTRKTLAEHTQFMRELAELSFYFTCQQRANYPDESASKILRDRTPMFIHALEIKGDDVDESAPCQRLLAAADEVAGTVDDAAEYSARLWPVIADFAAERAPVTYPISVGISVPDSWNVRSLKYDPPRDDVPRNQCNFHIANALAPRSILADPEHLPHCFLELMDRAEAEHGFDSLRTFTWLNDEPRWLALFPEEWHRNLGPPHPGVFGNWGFWGQVVNARGTLNHRVADYLREHGRLRYASRPSHCTFAAMRRHLHGLLGEPA